MLTIVAITPFRLVIGVITLIVALGLRAVAMAAANVTPAAARSTAAEARAAAASGPGRGAPIVTIPAGVALPGHRHARTEIASIPSGRLTYTVTIGAVPAYRTGADGTRTIKPCTTAVLRPGDSIAEEPGDGHRGANRGTVPVRIQLATLFPKGAPSSITVG